MWLCSRFTRFLAIRCDIWRAESSIVFPDLLFLSRTTRATGIRRGSRLFDPSDKCGSAHALHVFLPFAATFGGRKARLFFLLGFWAATAFGVELAYQAE